MIRDPEGKRRQATPTRVTLFGSVQHSANQLSDDREKGEAQMGTKVKRKAWDPSLWVSLKPFGIGEQHPNNYLEIWKALWENKEQLPYAWRILTRGVCDGCALGTTGTKDWTMKSIHLCNIRLRLLRLNTMPALDVHFLDDVSLLRAKPNDD